MILKQTNIQEIIRHEKWMMDAEYEKYITPMPNTYQVHQKIE